MNKCSCGNCGLEVFENSDKCILHCEKDDWFDENGKLKEHFRIIRNNFYEQISIYFEHTKKLNEEKTKETIRNPFITIKGDFNTPLENIQFPDVNFSDFYFWQYSDLYFRNCTFYGNFNNDLYKNDKLISFENCIFKNNLIAKYQIFNKDFVLNSCFIEGEMNIHKSIFKDIIDFSNSKFSDDVDLKHTTFEKIVNFRESNFKKELNLEDTIFKSNVNFLELKAKMKNRETARIIKDSFEKQNNIIESNKFYALEMKEREKELEEDIREGKNFFEWIVFKIHGLSSNHSQDWLLALFWIFIVGFIASYYDFNLIQNSEDKYIHYNLSSIFKTISLIFIILFIDRLCKIKDKFINISYFIISSYLIYIYATEDYLLSLFSQTINPFSVMKTNDPINGIQLFFKIIIAYLIYQLIISIRQNTRRK
ncbi:pentapeptide repeat-containing protein [Aliarcobacter butzleri]|uniref:pentapeptide repeat-containing protein n=1 Tax=Aliarcobacter butzleri TaxID=28197 RepID=UPI001EDF8418|nr:pentapeptide repeat-containing protein [Aliarcobacter butzleri]MCG3680335.1 pentapeptide repeat-containing protein [Aliarcobacter butzleri]